MKKDLAVLDTFLGSLPSDRQIVCEFRHASWNDDAVYESLRRRGAALCAAESGDYGVAVLRGWVKRIAAQPWQRAYTRPIFDRHPCLKLLILLRRRLFTLALVLPALGGHGRRGDEKIDDGELTGRCLHSSQRRGSRGQLIEAKGRSSSGR